jgi:hypothetical protein
MIRHFGSLPLAKLCDVDVAEGNQPQDLRRRIASLNRAIKTGREPLPSFFSIPRLLELK